MKKSLLSVLAIIVVIAFIILCIFLIQLDKNKSKQSEAKKYNLEYEQYINSQIYGTDVATIIGKAIKQNEKNKVPKDEKGHYIDNGTNSIRIDLKMVTIDGTYPM